ncbi:MAG: hypothetical protein JXA94_03540 [Parachlamydiales bacterium]|nr:hypothetical protein [Parachlamydiales bacterium]
MTSKKFLFNFKKLTLVLVNSLIILASCFLIWNSENVQKKLAPKKYWENKVKILEGNLKRDEIKIQTIEVDLQKELLICKCHKQEAQLKCMQTGEKFEDTFSCISDEHHKKLVEYKNELDNLKKIKEEERIALEKAVCNLKTAK